MRLAVLVRLLMLIACVVPFTSTRQAMAAVAQKTPGTALPVLPFIPVQEEEESERQQEVVGKEKVRGCPPPVPRPHVLRAGNLYAQAVTQPLTVIPSSPSPVDPFRNGLGCPFRC